LLVDGFMQHDRPPALIRRWPIFVTFNLLP
jgi:hypothetical protein